MQCNSRFYVIVQEIMADYLGIYCKSGYRVLEVCSTYQHGEMAKWHFKQDSVNSSCRPGYYLSSFVLSPDDTFIKNRVPGYILT